jgi:Tol biopolymer transport system component
MREMNKYIILFFLLLISGCGQVQTTEKPITHTYYQYQDHSSWSPDSSKLVFDSLSYSETQGYYHSELYVVNADGSNLHKITDFPDVFGPTYPDWAATGETIAFELNKYVYVTSEGGYGLDSQIYTMKIDGSNLIQLTTNAGVTPEDNSNADWSPDGTQILFITNPDSRQFPSRENICVVNSDGTGRMALTSSDPHVKQYYAPQWSSDAQNILCEIFDDNLDHHGVYLLDSNGSNEAALSDISDQYNERMPVWSPDGTKISYYGNHDGSYDIYTMNADGTNIVNLTNNPASDHSPQWSPDGTKISFISDRDGDYDLYVMNADGSNVKQITNF